MSKENVQFGEGSFVAAISSDPKFFNLPVREQAKIIGWANSCPVTDELTDPDNSNPGRGPEAMRERYAEVNFWFGFISRETQRLNPRLHNLLMTATDRDPHEPAGKFEQDNVPEWHKDKISPLGNLAGYALPRIFIEQLGTHKGVSREELQSRLSRGLEVLESVIPAAKTPIELLALAGEGLLDADCLPEDIFKHALSKGWLDEHNGTSKIVEYKQAIHSKAPKLWAAYSESINAELPNHP
jgi:hypothetical protein